MVRRHLSALTPLLALTFAVAPPTVGAALNKCVKEGVVTFQDEPCPETLGTAGQARRSLLRAGCYQDAASLADPNKSEVRFKIRGGRGLEMTDWDSRDWIPLRTATRDELKATERRVNKDINEVTSRYGPLSFKEGWVLDAGEFFVPLGYFGVLGNKGQPLVVGLMPYFLDELRPIPCP